MDNFYFLNVKPTIDRKETANIRDAIFKRAREKAEALTAEKNDNYTSQIQSDIMDIARENIKNTGSDINPFNQFLENIGKQNETVNKVDPIDKVKSESELEIPRLEEMYTKELKRNIESVSDKTYSNSMRDETMAAARNQFRTNLNTTLNFLNTQAAIRMAENAHSKINYTI